MTDSLTKEQHVAMLVRYAGIPGTPYHAAVCFALESIRNYDVAAAAHLAAELRIVELRKELDHVNEVLAHEMARARDAEEVLRVLQGEL